ncbi:MAG: hypothetical protein HZC29_03855 [Thaumarchaeota archaeon]|nr:hypothetical protein [Nitrososphaerota archaeon]
MGIKCRLLNVVEEKFIFKFNEQEIEITKEEYFSDDKFERLCKKYNVPEDADVGSRIKIIYDSEDGTNNRPGDMWYSKWIHQIYDDKDKCFYWDNCTDPRGHLIVRMPDGGTWGTDSKASNCTMKEDRTHRCWIKHGEAPNLTVDKQGHTCQAGAGSIQMISWHGFLRNGELVQ